MLAFHFISILLVVYLISMLYELGSSLPIRPLVDVNSKTLHIGMWRIVQQRGISKTLNSTHFTGSIMMFYHRICTQGSPTFAA